MRNTSKILAVVAAVAAIAIIASVMKLGKGSGNPTDVPQTNDERTAQIPQMTEGSSTSTTPKIKTVVRTTSQPNPSNQTPVTARVTNENPTTAKVMPLVPDWDDKINDILGPEGDEKEKSKKLIELFPQLPPEGQEEVAHHLSNLVADEDYAPLSNFVTNSALPEAVLDVFVEDVFNRPNAIKLPLLLDIAQDPQHPRASEAKDVLELFLEEDFGNDWTKWHAKMDQWLKDNPD
jgi:hypothetical protein